MKREGPQMMSESRSRLALYCGLLIFVIGTVTFIEGAVQQTPPPEILEQLRQRAPQEIDPPVPAEGEGIELTLNVIDAITGKGLPDAKIDLTRVLAPLQPINRGAAPAAAPDRRVWKYSKSSDGLGIVKISNIVADSYQLE